MKNTAETPILFVQDDLVFVPNPGITAAMAAIKLVAGVLLPDQSIAVLRMRMGESLGQQAGERASTLTGGRIVKIHCTEWPSAKRCFSAIRDEACAAMTPDDAARHLAAVQHNGRALQQVPAARQFVPDHVLQAGLRSLAPAGESDQAQELPAPAP